MEGWLGGRVIGNWNSSFACERATNNFWSKTNLSSSSSFHSFLASFSIDDNVIILDRTESARENSRLPLPRVISWTDANYVNYGVTARYKYPRTVSWKKKEKLKFRPYAALYVTLLFIPWAIILAVPSRKKIASRRGTGEEDYTRYTRARRWCKSTENQSSSLSPLAPSDRTFHDVPFETTKTSGQRFIANYRTGYFP